MFICGIFCVFKNALDIFQILSSEYTSTRRALIAAASDLPNQSHPNVVSKLKTLIYAEAIGALS